MEKRECVGLGWPRAVPSAPMQRRISVAWVAVLAVLMAACGPAAVGPAKATTPTSPAVGPATSPAPSGVGRCYMRDGWPSPAVARDGTATGGLALEGEFRTPDKSAPPVHVDKEVIRRVIRQHADDVRACYEQALASRPTEQGRVMIEFVIVSTGTVSAARLQNSTLNDPPVEDCIGRAICGWQFPPHDPGIVIISYPWVLDPGGATSKERSLHLPLPELARAYGFTDLDGTQPDAWSHM